MRGQGLADPAQITQDGSVGFYEDGFYISRPRIATFDLADVDRVEILRGPQGTLYGRNTTGGAVNVVSEKPTGEPGLKGEVTLGTRDHGRALAVIDLPKRFGLSAKLTLLGTTLDGYVSNPGVGRNYQNFGLMRQAAGKLQFRYEDGGPFTADYFFEHDGARSTPIYFENPLLQGLIPNYSGTGRPSAQAYTALPLPLSTSTSNAQGLTLGLVLNPKTTLKSLFGYRTFRSNGYQNYAGAFTNPFLYEVMGPSGFFVHDLIDSSELTAELQLLGDGDPGFSYVLGLYYFREGANHIEDVDISLPALFFNEPSSRRVVAESKSRAVYGQATWRPPGLDDRLSLTFGARFTQDDKDATRNETVSVDGIGVIASEVNAANNLTFRKFNPAGTIAYAWTADVSTYARIATGYKAGGSSESAAIGSFGITFAPEALTQYELGLKSYWLGQTLRINAAAFYSDIRNLQIHLETDPGNLAIGLVQNAGASTITGVELESLYRPTNDASIGFNWTYLDPKIREVDALAGTVFDANVNPSSPYHVGQNVTDVFRVPYAPRNVFDLTTDYTFLRTNSGAYSAQLKYRYQDRQFVSTLTGRAVPNNILYSIPGHGMLDARLTWRRDLPNSRQMRVSIWGNNVTHRHALQDLIAQGAFLPLPGTPMPGYTYQSLAWAAPPLWGIDLSYGP
ncbi:MAG: TonB-dependent receptor [Gammaproteobacteria bacterium]